MQIEMNTHKNRFTILKKLALGAAMILLFSCTTEEKQTLPSGSENEKIAVDTTLAFAEAVNANDLSLFRNQTTKEFKTEFSHEQFEKAFSGFIEQKINLLPVAKLKPQFHSPPFLREDGALTLKGYFPTRPSQVEFDYIFFWRDKGWKVSGISLQINPVNTSSQ